jgi:hypothetical protein
MELSTARLGITETHLSHLRNGTKIIGFQTFNFLKTLALGQRILSRKRARPCRSSNW